MDIGLDLTLIFFLLGALLCFLAIRLEAASLNQVKENASEFRVTDDAIEWRGLSVSIGAIEDSRDFFQSIGSCSIEEPLAGLRSLGWS